MSRTIALIIDLEKEEKGTGSRYSLLIYAVVFSQ